MDDSAELARLVEMWWEAIGDFTELLDELPPAEWTLASDLPGWDVHAIAAHIAHVESMLVGDPQTEVDVMATDHIRNPFGLFMESGVVARRDSSPTELIEEIRSCAGRRHDELQANPPSDGGASPERLPPGVTWNLATLLSNRSVDVWMHEQDVRRAVGRPGNLKTRPADHALSVLTGALPFVVAKRAGAPPGTTVTFEIGDQKLGVLVDERGRGLLDWGASDPGLRLGMTRETFAVAAGGRQRVSLDQVGCRGDVALAARILENIAVTQ